MIEAVLFDLDQTLLRFEITDGNRMHTSKGSVYEQLCIRTCRPLHARLIELGFSPPSFDKYLRLMKRSLIMAYLWSRVSHREVDLLATFRRGHRRLGMRLDEGQTIDVGSRCIEAVREFITMDEEAADLIRSLHKSGVRMGLVSNTMLPGFAIDEHLRAEGLLDYFPVRVYSSDVRYRKPHREIFRRALGLLNVDAEHTMFVGDRVDKDVKGAARVGMRTVLIRRNETPLRCRIRPDHIIRRLSEVTALVAR